MRHFQAREGDEENVIVLCEKIVGVMGSKDALRLIQNTGQDREKTSENLKTLILMSDLVMLVEISKQPGLEHLYLTRPSITQTLSDASLEMELSALHQDLRNCEEINAFYIVINSYSETIEKVRHIVTEILS